MVGISQLAEGLLLSASEASLAAYTTSMSTAAQRAAQPTLMVFTLGASGERRRRPLLPERFAGEERALRRACLDSVLAAGRAAGCRLLVASPRHLDLGDDVEYLDQQGVGFGARLRSAIDQAARQVAGPLLVVGSDAPNLTSSHLCQALEQLQRDPDGVVLGPAVDGGFYLLAVDRLSTQLAALLADVRWCRADTRRSLNASLRRSGHRPVLLSSLRDLDRRRDLERWLARRPARTLRRLAGLLLRLLSSLRCSAVAPPRVVLPHPATVASGRAPPV